MSDPLDFKKTDKKLYSPKPAPEIIAVPTMKFIMVDGRGSPNDETGEYAKAVELIYGLAYTIKMSSKSGNPPPGFFEYVVPPLEGLWWTETDRPFDTGQTDQLIWTSMIRQPDFVTEEVLHWAAAALQKKKPELDTAKAKLADYTEGLCVQMMHLGPYNTEAVTVQAMDDFAAREGYTSAISTLNPEGITLRHHEIYLNDPRKVAPEKMKTVLRHPIRK